jgi:hypothetical protein
MTTMINKKKTLDTIVAWNLHDIDNFSDDLVKKIQKLLTYSVKKYVLNFQWKCYWRLLLEILIGKAGDSEIHDLCRDNRPIFFKLPTVFYMYTVIIVCNSRTTCSWHPDGSFACESARMLLVIVMWKGKRCNGNHSLVDECFYFPDWVGSMLIVILGMWYRTFFVQRTHNSAS